MQEIARRAGGMLAAQEEFCPMELFRFSRLCFTTGNGKPEGYCNKHSPNLICC